ncbi:MAG: hypothetical protein EOP11_00290 [Proteobacteria bacterium]|nr:MAG: hypothetical protein EOP11_00290 [Pseudomonadota bacterium]
MSARVLAFPATSEFCLERRGSQLHWAGRRTWNMVGVHGPLKSPNGKRQYFRVHTDKNETLIVYREKGERGMRQLYLFCLGEEEIRSEMEGGPALN